LNKRLTNQEQAMKGVLDLKMQEKLKVFEGKLEKKMSQAYQLLNEIKSGDIATKKQIYRKESEIKSGLKTPVQDSYEELNLMKPKEILKNRYYYSPLLREDVFIESLNNKKQEVLVTHKGKKVNLKIKTLLTPKQNKHKQKNKQEIQIHIQTHNEHRLEYDCRGMRLSEFQDLVEQSISSVLLKQVPYINYIHGHGTGVLKNWIRGFVKKNKALRIDLNDTGNDGETRVTLAN
jgi:DNA mismatch repair protein MutS2